MEQNPRRGADIKKGQGHLLSLLGVKKVMLAAIRLFNFKMSTGGASTLHQKNMTGFMLFYNWHLLGVQKGFKQHPQHRILLPLRDSFQNF